MTHRYKLTDAEIAGFELLVSLLTDAKSEQNKLITLGTKLITLGTKLQVAVAISKSTKTLPVIELTDAQLEYVMDLLHTKLDAAPNASLACFNECLVRQTDSDYLSEWSGTQTLKSIL